MRREVDAEADAHDEIDHGDTVEIDVPQRHVTGHPELDRHDAEGDPQAAEHVGDEDEADQHHDERTEDHALDAGRPDQLELVEEHEVRMEHARVQRRRVADAAQLFHHVLFLIGAAHVHRLYQESARYDLLVRIVELDIQRTGADRIQPELLQGLVEATLICDGHVQIIPVIRYVFEKIAQPALTVELRADVFARLEASHQALHLLLKYRIAIVILAAYNHLKKLYTSNIFYFRIGNLQHVHITRINR